MHWLRELDVTNHGQCPAAVSFTGWLGRKLLESLEERLPLDTVMQRARKIAETLTNKTRQLLFVQDNASLHQKPIRSHDMPR